MVRSGVWAELVSGFSALGVLVTLSLPPSATSHAQPLPNCVAPRRLELRLELVERAKVALNRLLQLAARLACTRRPMAR